MPSIEFFPYPLILGLLWLALCMAQQRSRGWRYLIVLGLFGLYLLKVIELVAFPILLPETWPAAGSWQEFAFTLTHTINLLPFNYGRMFADLAAERIPAMVVYREIIGNILLTVPFGLMINFFYPLRLRQAAWLALAAGAALEGTQLLILLTVGISLHTVDINDVLLNALGVLIGYAIYLGGRRLFLRVGRLFAPWILPR
jgi:glycopeptide antibiotics resistance protein